MDLLGGGGGGGEVNRLLLGCYADVLKDASRFLWYEMDPHEEVQGRDVVEAKRDGGAPLFGWRLKDHMPAPSFAILGSKIFAVGFGGSVISSRDYSSCNAQSLDISDAIAAGCGCDDADKGELTNMEGELTNMEEAILSPHLFVYKNKLYAFGFLAKDDYPRILSAAEFDPGSGSWKQFNTPGTDLELLDGINPPQELQYLIYPVFILQDRPHIVLLKILDVLFSFDMELHQWRQGTDLLPDVSYFRHHIDQAVVMDGFLYACSPTTTTTTTDQFELMAYDLSNSFWLEGSILEPFPANRVILSQIGENTLCLCCCIFDNKTASTSVYCIKVQLTKTLDHAAQMFQLEPPIVTKTPCYVFQGVLTSCIPFSAPVNGKANKERSREHMGEQCKAGRKRLHGEIQ